MPPAGAPSRMPGRPWTAAMSPSCSTRPRTGSGGEITRAYKAKLTKARRKEFRSLMWEFRRNPEGLTEEEKAKLGGPFEKLPRLRKVHGIRVRSQEIFDTARGRRQALRWLTGLWLEVLGHFPAMGPFLCTFEAWQEGVLSYFGARQTSGPVEGINNEARVIVKRAYGLKSADSLWARLVLDLNRAQDVVGRTVGQVRDLVTAFRGIFSCACT
jgi:transposase